MCTAVIKPIGISMPDKDTLKRLWDKNPDGAGYAHYNSDELSWHVKKGFIQWNNFWDSFQAEEFTDDHTVFVHFRIGTSGSKAHPDHTHPFPVSNKKDLLNCHEFVSPHIVMHNGVWGTGKDGLSDTQIVIKEYLFPILNYLRKDDSLLPIVEHALDTKYNRWVITDSNEYWQLGDWVKDDNGVYYSNDKYKVPKVVVSTNKNTDYSKYYYYNKYLYPQGWNNNSKTITPATLSTTKTDTHDFLMLFHNKTAESYLDGNGVWCWNQWIIDNTMNNDSVQEEKPEIKTIEVYDTDNNPIAIVDEKGEAIWLDDDEDDTEDIYDYDTSPELLSLIKLHGPDYEFDCTQCGNPLTIRDIITDGTCPFCLEILIPVNNDNNSLEDVIEECPSCSETRYLIDPAYGVAMLPVQDVFLIHEDLTINGALDQATTECCRCGCFWKDIDYILGYNNTVHRHYINRMEEGDERSCDTSL